METFFWPFGDLEQFIQIANAGPEGESAGALIDKSAKARLADLGLVTPKYGAMFRLTPLGERVWSEVRRIIGYTDPWRVGGVK